MIAVFLLNIFYALVCPIGKVALYYTSPLFLTGFRMVLGGAVVLAYQYIFRRDRFVVPTISWWPLFWAAVYTIYLTNWLEFLALEHLTPAKTSFLYNLYPFVSALLSVTYLREGLSGKKWLGICIGLLGSIPLLISADAADPHLYKYFGLVSVPELALLASVLVCPLGWIFIQKAVCQKGCDSVMANSVTMLIGGLMALVHSGLTENWNPVPVTNVPWFLITTGGLIVVSNLICNTMYIELLKKYTITFLSFTGFITPIVTAIFDWLFFGYRVPTTFYISMSIMFIGFYIFYKAEETTPI
ncbi:DMT family transporter [Candidatus Dependentiae bacterium]|nr:DMT family transporter [Candidatus Dependentiae bacterium]